MNCEKCKHHSVAGFRLEAGSVPQCSHSKPNRDLPWKEAPSLSDGVENVWSGTTLIGVLRITEKIMNDSGRGKDNRLKEKEFIGVRDLIPNPNFKR